MNNSIAIMNLSQGNKVLSRLDNVCISPNHTNANLYFRHFYDPFLIVFCNQATSIVEYIIHNGTFLY